MGEAKRRKKSDVLFGKGNAEKFLYWHENNGLENCQRLLESLPQSIDRYMGTTLRQICLSSARMQTEKVWAVVDINLKIYRSSIEVIAYAFCVNRHTDADTQLNDYLGQGLEAQAELTCLGFGTFGQGFVVIFDPELSDNTPDFFLKEDGGELLTHAEMTKRIEDLLVPARESHTLSLAA